MSFKTSFCHPPQATQDLQRTPPFVVCLLLEDSPIIQRTQHMELMDDSTIASYTATNVIFVLMMHLVDARVEPQVDMQIEACQGK